MMPHNFRFRQTWNGKFILQKLTTWVEHDTYGYDWKASAWKDVDINALLEFIGERNE